ncbi:hypothetical protein HHL16_22285 [Pseudoflavitalea sp. G-6-1-2]|uniref:hypothetical protein n=1 Tax=Pseudoflavitalea sp. G-6-1-2 TaxID=2728841 RepID=UPI00146E000C|nr:hypothetical protein [Pseudoflavitalea sp. G-6-1-2]NML23625.1 hypothetical protein [Pseudoflavitalea sp. G-6-1-2]
MNANKQAPDHLAPFSVYDNPDYFNKMHAIEWRAQLQSSHGGRLFRILYYNELYNWPVKDTPQHREFHEKNYGKHFAGLIAGSDFAPELIYAVDIVSGEKILLFDGCVHGYNNLFCDEWLTEETNKRVADKVYRDSAGNEVFEIVPVAFFNIDYEEEQATMKDTQGDIRLLNGEKVTLDWLQRNGFDAFGINAYSAKGGFVSVHSAELA